MEGINRKAANPIGAVERARSVLEVFREEGIPVGDFKPNAESDCGNLKRLSLRGYAMLID